MKKIAPFLIVFLLAMVAWEALFDSSGMNFMIDGDHIDGPAGALMAMLFAGGGLVLGAVALVFALALVAVVFAGLGLMAVVGLVMAALVLAACLTPVLLPLVIPVAIIWYLLSRDRKQRIVRDNAQAAAVAPAHPAGA